MIAFLTFWLWGALTPLPDSQAASNSLQWNSNTELTGYLNILYADGKPGQKRVETHYFLSRPGEDDTPLQFGSTLPVPFDQLNRMRGQRIKVSGRWNNVADPALEVSAIDLENQADTAYDVMLAGSQPWVTVMCKFKNDSSEPYPPSYFQGMYGGAFPLLDHYWRELSYNQMNIGGSLAVNQWYTLPQPRSYYITSSGANLSQLAIDCTAAADAAVNFPTYVGINLMFNNDLDGYAWGGTRYMTLDGAYRRWYMTWEPPWGYSDLTVIEHEMGHGFGMPHSAFDRSAVYDSRWDVMSDTWTDCMNSYNVTYGCLGQSTIAYHKDLEGWLGGKKVAVAAGSRVTVTLEQLDLPQTQNTLLVTVPISGTNRFYTVEVRRKMGYDVKLPGQAVIIHKVDPSQSIPAQLVDLDGNTNTGDAGAMWVAGETFTDPASSISIRVDQAISTGFVVTISNAVGTSSTPTPTTPAATSTPTPTPVTKTPTPIPTLVPTARSGGQSKSIFLPYLSNTITY